MRLPIIMLGMDIEDWVNKLKSRIVMKECDDSVEEIINDYILCG